MENVSRNYLPEHKKEESANRAKARGAKLQGLSHGSQLHIIMFWGSIVQSLWQRTVLLFVQLSNMGFEKRK